MSDGALSQDEIDALMSGSSAGFDFESTASNDGGLSENEKQSFLAIVNSIIDTQSATLSGMMGKTVTISPPSIEILAGGNIAAGFDGSFVRIQSSFTDGVPGYHSYLLTDDISKAMAGLLSGLDQVELDEASLSAVSEAINTISGSAMTVFGDRIGETIMSEPATAEVFDASTSDIPTGDLLKLNYPITIEDHPPSVFNELFDISVVKKIITEIAAPAAGKNQAAQSQQAPRQQSSPQQSMGNMGAPAGASMGGGIQNQGYVNIQNVQYPSLASLGSTSEQGNISLLMDVNMEMTVELGRTKKPIREILSMGEGTIIELDKLAGEPVDILVNHKLIANGEVVVIDENFGVRVTKIVSNPTGVNDVT
ncbi:MAG: flagellar motor switch phosphatase FliY [Spirochaetaceae bacterium]|nr:flagellar motor switch phosphatase FliY [Spirochaetaceae bacterium]